MNITDYQFPVLTDLDLAFSTLETPQDLLQEARSKKMDYPMNIYNRLASHIFYRNDEIILNEDLDPKFSEDALRFLRAFIRSFAPKHEDKIAVCALISFPLTDPKIGIVNLFERLLFQKKVPDNHMAIGDFLNCKFLLPDFAGKIWGWLKSRNIMLGDYHRGVFCDIACCFFGAAFHKECPETPKKYTLLTDQRQLYLLHESLYHLRYDSLLDTRAFSYLLYDLCFCHVSDLL